MTDTQQTAPQAQPGTASGLSIASLVLGIVGVCCPPLSVTALVLGLVEWTNINKGRAAQAGYGLSLAGWILGLLSTLAWALLFTLNLLPLLVVFPFMMFTGF